MQLFIILCYVCAVVLILTFTIRIAWALLVLFLFRFWTGIITYDFISKTVGMSINPIMYTVGMLALCFISILAINYAAQAAPGARVIISILLLVYFMFRYDFSELVFFKDVLQQTGLWGSGFTKQLTEMISIPFDQQQNIFTKIVEDVMNFGEKLTNAIQKK